LNPSDTASFRLRLVRQTSVCRNLRIQPVKVMRQTEVCRTPQPGQSGQPPALWL